MIEELYNPQILNKAAQISRIGRLPDAHATASRRSKYCGSTITVDLKAQDGVVVDFAQQIQACALGQAAAAIVASHIIGTDFAELKILHIAVTKMLQENALPPQGRFVDFALLQPVKDYKARHGAVLLVLEAVVDCIEQIEHEEAKI